MARYFLHLSYLGTRYHGWQRQDNSITVQQKIEEALIKISVAYQGLMGCGRTDTGVHASNFYAHLDILGTELDLKKIMHSLNAVLPEDIAIYKIIAVAEDAHARFDATGRSYTYRIHHRKEPLLHERSHLIHQALDISQMNACTSTLLGRKEFTSFARLHGGQKHDFCDVKSAHWRELDGNTVFQISADRFLRNMVRAIVGTMIEVGLGKCSKAAFEEIIKSKDRNAAGTSAPACGLSLDRVEYPYLGPNVS